MRDDSAGPVPSRPRVERDAEDRRRVKPIRIRLAALEGPDDAPPERSSMEFHVKKSVRDALGIEDSLFQLTGNCILPNFLSSRVLAQRLNERADAALRPDRAFKAGQVNAMGLIDEILHYVCSLYRLKRGEDVFARALSAVESAIGSRGAETLLSSFLSDFPPMAVYRGKTGLADYLAGATDGRSNREIALEELLMLWLANDNPAFSPFAELFDDSGLRKAPEYPKAVEALRSFFAGEPGFGPDGQSLVDLLKSPAIAVPNSLPGQLDYIRKRWGLLLGDYLLRILSSLDLLKEEEKAFFPGPGPSRVLAYEGLEHEYERFSMDKDWMPRVVMIAKSVLVWLFQLSQAYGRPIRRLDEIPDEELDSLASRGFTALWLIGVWERSMASERIKKACGNPEAAASAYSIFDYQIAGELGGWEALADLRARSAYRGIRLASDMVPNHTGMESLWMKDRPDYFIQSRTCPFPAYSFSGANLSGDPDVGVFLEDRYYSRTDAAVVFKRVDFRTGDVRYIYHGNDGTSMPWNDTAQIDYLNREAREAVKATILNVARNFPIIRFDAAMVLAKRHIRRLWFPEPGSGGDIPSRSEHAISRADFDAAMPEEFWREVVDLCAAEAPDTLLLAEAFWMLEGYFVRTLGMHRVYNSAFMNMLKREENSKYRETIRNTLEFDPEILKRFVNFLNNPDEETAAAQFGRGDKYFGVCTMMVTMPGLPMFGHGQVEGCEEKYGVEFRRAYWNESPDRAFVERHEREIFPLMKKRHLFASASEFLLFDLRADDGSVNENVFAYANGHGTERALVLFNNAFPRAWGRLSDSTPFLDKANGGAKRSRTIAEGLGLTGGAGRFCLMREQRSDLWFIRDSREIAERGLFVSLDGYQCQVFLDVGEIEDNQLGQYRKLHDHLAGAGVRDVSAAMQDIFLKDLYGALEELCSPAFFESMRFLLAPAAGAAPESRARPVPASAAKGAKAGSAAAAPAAPRTLPAFLKAVEAPFKAFFRTALRFLEGTSEYDGFEAARATREATESEAFASFSSAIKDLAALAAGIGERSNASLAWMSDSFRADPSAFDRAVALVVMTELRSAIGHGSSFADLGRLLDHWRVDRKLVDILSARPSDRDRAELAMRAMRAMVARIDVPARHPLMGDAERAAELFRSFTADGEIVSLLGVNEYGGKRWFVKERFEDVLWCSFIVYSLYYLDKPDAASGRKIAAAPKGAADRASRMSANSGILAAFLEAETASGYDLAKLAESLTSIAARAVVARERKRIPPQGSTGRGAATAKKSEAPARRERTKAETAKKKVRVEKATAAQKAKTTEKAKRSKVEKRPAPAKAPIARKSAKKAKGAKTAKSAKKSTKRYAGKKA